MNMVSLKCAAEAEKFQSYTLFNVAIQGTLHPERIMKSDYQVDDETRLELFKKEQWHFCALQLGWFTVVVFLTSMFELMIFTIGFLGSDF